MRHSKLTLVTFLLTCLLACIKPAPIDKNIPDTSNWVVHCETIKKELLNHDPSEPYTEVLSSEINRLLKRLPPYPTDTDPTGHLENLKAFVATLNLQCEEVFEMELGCYACLEPGNTASMVYYKTSEISDPLILKIITPAGKPMRLAKNE